MKVLVLCHGNKYRSPLCMAWLRHYGVEAESMGFVRPDQRAAKPIRIIAAKQGLDLESHRSRVVTKDQLKSYDVVVWMSLSNLKRLILLSPGGPSPGCAWVCLGAYLDPPQPIKDPAFLNPRLSGFKLVVSMIETGSRRLARAIHAGGAIDRERVIRMRYLIEGASSTWGVWMGQ